MHGGNNTKTLSNKVASWNKAVVHGCKEDVVDWCLYRLDESLVKALVKCIGNATVTELGAGVGRYARAVMFYGKVSSYTAYDGMPGIDEISQGWVHYGDLSNASLQVKKSDYVITLETAEHVPRQFETTLMNNIVKAAMKGVIISWSTSRSGVGHVNIKSVKDVTDLFSRRGFYLDRNSTSELRQAAYYWYFRKNILVFKRRLVGITSQH